MSEKLYSLEVIIDAMTDALVEDCADFALGRAWVAGVKRRLTRPQPEFREGQVVFFGERYMLYGRHDYAQTSKHPWNPARPLTPEEVGPGYVPVEDVRPLVKTLCNIKNSRAHEISSAALCAIGETLDALPDNLRRLIDE